MTKTKEPVVLVSEPTHEDVLRADGFTILPAFPRTANVNVDWLNGTLPVASPSRICLFDSDKATGTAYKEVIFLDPVELVCSTEWDARCERYDRNVRLKTHGRVAVKK